MLESTPGQHASAVIVLADSEPMLIAQARQRNQHAFRRLYDRYLGKVYGLCLRMTGSRQMAEEATQEVFIQVWRKIDTFAGDSSFSTWLHSLAANTRGSCSYCMRSRVIGRKRSPVRSVSRSVPSRRSSIARAN